MAIVEGKPEDPGAAVVRGEYLSVGQSLENRVTHCFVAMPFADDFLPVWDCIQECIRNLKNEKHKISIIRASEKNKADEIPQNVFNHIKDADIIIVDATNFNANVVFEFGYARALKKIIIPMIQGSRKDLPTDFSQYIFESYKLDELDGLLLRLRLRLKDAIKVLTKEQETKQLKADVRIEQADFNVTCIKNRQHAGLALQFAKAKSDLISEEAPQGGVYAQDEVHNCIQQPLFLQQDKIGQNVDLPGTKRLPCIALSTSQK